jgi:hypothetical protein
MGDRRGRGRTRDLAERISTAAVQVLLVRALEGPRSSLDKGGRRSTPKLRSKQRADSSTSRANRSKKLILVKHYRRSREHLYLTAL